jgi:RNA 3'-terminal phosphate cyclase (ATP)
MIQIDGSQGEGGGQVLRTALSLALVTRQPCRVFNIRDGRANPGLQRQHLTCLQAAAAISDAKVTGAELHARELVFEPGAVRAGEYHFQTGGAGSTTLVLQTILPALATAGGASSIGIEGGTHNPMAPPFEYLDRCFVPVVKRMGPSIKLRLDRHGFYPAGGGKIRATITPSTAWKPIELTTRGEMVNCRARVIMSQLPPNIADREVKVVKRRMALDYKSVTHEEVKAHSPCNLVLVEMEFPEVGEVATSFGEKGVRAEAVAERAAKDAQRYLDADCPVGEHLADQLLLPFALAGGGRFHTLEPTNHTTTNIEVIRAFLDVDIKVRQLTDLVWEISFRRSNN